MKKIGIFAGTFDPVHEGHLDFARAALEAGLEKVYLLVEPRPRRKQGVRALEHRRNMVHLAVIDEPKLGHIILEQARFTAHETLPVLQERFKGYKLVLLFGDDILNHIAHWPHIEELVNSVQLMVATRGESVSKLAERMKTLEQTRHLKFRYEFVELSSTVTSSKIRLSLKHGQTPDGLPEKIKAYVQQEGLYVSDSAGS